MQKIAVIGAGTMGNGIAHVFAQNGYAVHLIDVSPTALDKALATIDKNLERQGFTKYQKTSTGRYEKILGDGPDLIRKEDHV